MTYDPYVTANSVVMARYNHLQEKGKEPQLAIYRGKQLVITTYHADSRSEKIYQVYQKILYSILQLCCLLEKNIQKINLLENQVYQYHLQLASFRYQESIDSLAEEKSRLASETTELEKTRNTLEEKITEQNQNLKNINTEYEEAQQLVQQKEHLEKELKKSNSTLRLIQHQVEEQKEIKQRLVPVQEEMNRLQEKLQELRSKIGEASQNDFEKKYHSLKQLMSKVKTILHGELHSYCYHLEFLKKDGLFVPQRRQPTYPRQTEENHCKTLENVVFHLLSSRK